MSVIEEMHRIELLETEKVKPVRLAHVVLRTVQFEAMRDFYLELLNARIAWGNEGICFMSYDEEHHRIVVIRIPHLEPVNPRAAGLEHYAFTYNTMGELLGNYSRLKRQGILPVWCINHGFTTSIYYSDPDGNMIETQFDNMSAPEADEFMKGEYFARNPIGVDFDPELLLQRYREGVALSELVKFKAAPYEAGVPHIRPMGVPPYDADGELL